MMAALMCPEDERIADLDGVKEQPGMSSIDWEGVAARRIPAPMIPIIKSSDDATNFNPEAEISGVDWGSLQPFDGDNDWCRDF